MIDDRFLVRRGGIIMALSALGSLWPEPLDASGFAIREQSAAFQGTAFAGVAAGGHDISTLYFNPATLTLQDAKASGNVSLSFIAPRAEFDVASASDGSGNPLGGTSAGDIADDALLPAVYGSVRFDDWHLGVGLTAPFGLSTNPPDTWVGRYHATESELVTVNINPVIAYQATPRIGIAAGVVVQYADATLARAVDLSDRLVGPNTPPSPATDGISEVKGDDWDVGFSLGVLAEPIDGTRIGVGYRSQINHSLEGDFTLTAGGATLAAASGRAALATPQSVSLGVRQRLTDRLDVLGTVEWTGWDSFDTLRVTFDDLALSPSVTEENWDNTWFFALGAEYRPTPAVVLQAGVAYDQSPIDDEFRTPRIPGNDRTWLSVGAAWTPREWVSVGAGYSHLFVDDGDIELSGGATDAGGRGDLRGRFENSVDILAAHGTLRF